MPHVLDDIDIPQHPSLSPEYDERHALPRGLPAPRCERSWFLVLLCRLITPTPRLPMRWQGHGTPGAPRFQTPLDILAREYPDLHLRVMAGMG